jgi:hypothetical protein
MNTLAVRAAVPTMAPGPIDLVRRLETENLARPQTELGFEHHLHAGLYARTMIVPDLGEGQRCLITGAFIQVPTLLVSHGDALVYIGEDAPVHLTGYQIIEAAAGRKQAFLAAGGFRLTMIFATSARTVEEAEEEFTPEARRLQSRRL